MTDPKYDYDVLVVGSGFGGSVSSLRLTEKGYRVGVLEAGRRYQDSTLPKTSWRLRKFLWAPRLGLRGIQRITFLRNLVVLSGSGVGGGSLVYANVLYRALDAALRDPQWAGITDWADELAEHYARGERMLGVVTNPTVTRHDVALRDVADDLGVGSSFRLTPVGVFFGEPGTEVPDPYFDGEGPPRRGCIECGECMIGCRYGAKNRLDRNYLFLAERKRAGARRQRGRRGASAAGRWVRGGVARTPAVADAPTSLADAAGGVRRWHVGDHPAAAADARHR